MGSNSPSMFQIVLSRNLIKRCPTYGDLCQVLLMFENPLLVIGIFRYPGGKSSSYSLLVSLEAAQVLDFRQKGDSRKYAARILCTVKLALGRKILMKLA